MTPLAQAKTNPCKEVIESAEKVIQKQADLIEVMRKRNESLFHEKTSLEIMLEESQRQVDENFKTEVIVGVVGIAIGVLATSLLVRGR